jgi:NADH-quinone oxidoreductase subunit C
MIALTELELEKENQMLEALKNQFPEDIIEAKVQRKNRILVKVKKEKIFEICKFASEKLELEHLSSIAGVEYGSEFEVVYQIATYKHPVVLTLKTRIPAQDPKIPSVVSIWWNANWYERETYDLLGIVFEGHPRLERLLLPQEWKVHPLRKEWKLPKKAVEQ